MSLADIDALFESTHWEFPEDFIFSTSTYSVTLSLT
jgi:hypothetical protein